MGDLDAELQAAMSALEASFHVHLIATYKPQLRCIPHDAVAAEWLETANADFDQFPVTDHDSVVGLLYRHDLRSSGTAEDAMYPLWEGVVVSSNMPISELIPEMGGLKARLVLRGAKVDGLVTPSDLLKLPVRLCVFSLLTHLEQVMAELISTRWPGDAWKDLLSAGRQTKIAEKQADLQARRMNPPLLELTDFADKRDLCRKVIEDGKKKFDRELNALRDLRDKLAHASSFIDERQGHQGVNEFVNQFQSARRWITQLNELTRALKATA